MVKIKWILLIICLICCVSCYSHEYDSNLCISDTDSLGRTICEYVILKNSICAYKKQEGFPDCVLKKNMEFNVIGEYESRYICLFSDKILFINKDDIKLDHDINYIYKDSLNKKELIISSIEIQLQKSIDCVNELIESFKNRLFFKYATCFCENGIECGYKFCIFNNSKKSISSFNISFYGTDDYGNAVSSSNGGYMVTRKCIGVIKPNDEMKYRADGIWFGSVHNSQISKLVLNYEDGTTDEIKDPNKLVCEKKLSDYQLEMELLEDFNNYKDYFGNEFLNNK